MTPIKNQMAWPIVALVLVVFVAGVGLAEDDQNDTQNDTQNGMQEDDQKSDETVFYSVEMLSYRDAMNQGRNEHKPILLYFTANYSGEMGVHMENTFADMHVISFLSTHYTVATVDIAELTSLAEKYQVESVPTLWFLDSDGKRLTMINGAMSVEKLLSVGQFVVDKAYIHSTYKAWASRQKSQSRGDGGH